MKSIWVPILVAALACFAGTAVGQVVEPDIEMPDLIVGSDDISILLGGFGPVSAPAEAEPCFTLKETGQCGQDAIGPSISCPDGSSGPGWIITAEKTYKCMVCMKGQSGRKKCDNTRGEAYMKLQGFGCPGGSWGSVGAPTNLITCKSAELSGGDCEG